MAILRDPFTWAPANPSFCCTRSCAPQQVWTNVALKIAGTGRYEVHAPTMVGHHGGPRAGTFLLDTHVFADDIERQLDALGWETAHIVGNSPGGWVSLNPKAAAGPAR